ncbi:MAG: nicotinate (nicotinamide) nucleotide adenylyltransferase [Bacteroidetes bacterium]|nr:nicotinate (nicotinamide) nucleotide adenylyltransferase [Bacteroidota bacterium]MCH8523618.1 nicotinate (nicotinamide) nucleotide adenylyltransferase [Balneolales bacterium]
MTQRVGLLGGMFDPVHTGHMAIVNSFLNSGLIDDLWVVPSYKPPHKSVEGLTSFMHRLEMLELAFFKMDRVKVVDIEQHLPSPGYTLQTLRHLQSKYPQTLFMWCIGSDNLNSFNTWFQYEQILSGWMLLVASRPDYNIDSVPSDIQNRCTLVTHTPVGISSTSIRNEIMTSGESENIPSSVMKYIKSNHLYSN